jgi:DNA repair protein RadD
LGHIDLIIIDECHLVNHKDQGGYRNLINKLTEINKHIRVVGLTATPFRLGHGKINEGDALFHELLRPVSIEELVDRGFLSNLRSKRTDTVFDVSLVRKRGGEYIEGELAAAVNTKGKNESVVREIIGRAGDRKAWLCFCTGVAHAKAISDLLNEYGIPSDYVIGSTPKEKRERIIADFKAGKLRALTNANVLTTGFDYPDIDLIAMLRPTMSASLYVQMAGRGMRVKSHTDHCLVLDFAGVISKHGPITSVEPEKYNEEKSDGGGEAPVKVCGICDELVPISQKECPSCGYMFVTPEEEEEDKSKKLELHNDDIMGLSPTEMPVTSWRWRKHISRTSGKPMLAVSYYGYLSDPIVTEYFPVLHPGYAGEVSRKTVVEIANKAGIIILDTEGLENIAKQLQGADLPKHIKFKVEGKFHRVLERAWERETVEAA